MFVPSACTVPAIGVSGVWNSACMRPRYGVLDCGPMTGVASQPIDSTLPGGLLALRIASITVAGGEGSALSMVWLQYVAHHKGPFVTFKPSSVTVHLWYSLGRQAVFIKMVRRTEL
jgi:hypothetical protein